MQHFFVLILLFQFDRFAEIVGSGRTCSLVFRITFVDRINSFNFFMSVGTEIVPKHCLEVNL